MKYTLLFMALFTLSCSPTSSKIIGNWSIYQLIQQEHDMTEEHDPHNERYLILKDDNTFESGGRPFGKNTGKYNFNKKDQTLFLDSDAGEDDDSKLLVKVRNATMMWQGFGNECADQFKIIKVRAN